MKEEIERNLGPQPIAQIMADKELNAHDLVKSSPEPITHKMVTRACKGRRLSPNVRIKIQNALNAATDSEYPMSALFNYLKPKAKAEAPPPPTDEETEEE